MATLSPKKTSRPPINNTEYNNLHKNTWEVSRELQLKGEPGRNHVSLPLRELTKTKGGFPNDQSLLKLLYLGIQNASKKWTMPIQNWNLTLSQLAIFFEGRFDTALDL